MQKTKIGSILDEVQKGIIVQQVNAQGVMGSGIAKAIRAKWPKVFETYSYHMGPAYSQKDSGRDYLGKVITVRVAEELYVANVIGQQFFGREPRRYTSYDALDKGFAEIAYFASVTCLDVHYPLIGCGLGGGDWTIVSAIIDANLDTINHTLWMLPTAE